MQILFASPFYPPFAPGGAEHSLQEMCRQFSSVGIRAHVVSNACTQGSLFEERDECLLHLMESPMHWLQGQDITGGGYLNSEVYRSRLTERLTAIAQDLTDCILVANNAQCFVSVASVGTALGLPSLGIVRDPQCVCEYGACIDGVMAKNAVPCESFWESLCCLRTFRRQRGFSSIMDWPGIVRQTREARKRRAHLRESGLSRLDRVVAISDAMASLIQKLPQMAGRRVHKIHNFRTHLDPASDSDVSNFLSEHGLIKGRFFLMAGKKSIGKGVDLAVRAAQTVQSKHSDVKLLLVGKGCCHMPSPKALVDAASVERSLLLGLLSSSAGLLIPGRWQEGLHRTMIDAVYMGVPIVCSEAGGTREGVRNGLNGYVVPCNSSFEFAKAMSCILAWSARSQAICRETANEIFHTQFSDDVITGQWEHLFNDMTRNGSRNE